MLTKQQIDVFHRDGLLVLRGVFNEEEVRALQQAADERRAKQSPAPVPVTAIATSTAVGSTTGPTGCSGSATRRFALPRSTPTCWRRWPNAWAIRFCRSTTLWW